MDLRSPLQHVKGVGPAVAEKLKTLKLETVEDLLLNFPRKYEDYSELIPIGQIKQGQVSVQGRVTQVAGRYVRRGLHITEAIISDETGSLRVVWFNQPYRATAIKKDAEYFLSGNFELSNRRFVLMNPSMELVSSFPTNTARVIPVYRETIGLKSHVIRKLIRELAPLIDSLPESMPDWLMVTFRLMPRAQAVFAVHFPKDVEDLARARARLGFEEVFYLTLASLLNKYELYTEHSLTIPFDEALIKEFVSSLPFPLTDAQRRVAWQIFKDLEKTQPMNRLVEGDVGSGKTIVAAMAAIETIAAGYQVSLMAPTEILARQHQETLNAIFQNFHPLPLKAELLVSGIKSPDKTRIKDAVKSGATRLVVGTHALIEEDVDMHKLGLVIIDEQHRFGVDQRKKLQAKAGHMPHVLSMTATPIPRTLALTLYGELDISVIDELPPGRKPVKTEIHSPNSRSQLYKQIDEQIEAGRQVFVVCPLISESDNLGVTSVEQEYEKLQKTIFKHRRIGLLHGKLKSDEKEQIIASFARHELDILIATTVIEVGVNIPNASVMLIEGAERFGLAQLHQLRGRVGRSSHQAYCFLVPSNSKEPSQRLRALESSTDGFRLAEFDLELRGPGAIYGTRQSGILDLRIAKLTDTKLIAAA